MVDEVRTWPHAKAPFKSGSAHLTTDGSLEDLHAFAKLIGMRRAWFQDGRVPHYDLTPARVLVAMCNGAVFIPAKEQARERRASRPQKIHNGGNHADGT